MPVSLLERLNTVIDLKSYLEESARLSRRLVLDNPSLAGSAMHRAAIEAEAAGVADLVRILNEQNLEGESLAHGLADAMIESFDREESAEDTVEGSSSQEEITKDDMLSYLKILFFLAEKSEASLLEHLALKDSSDQSLISKILQLRSQRCLRELMKLLSGISDKNQLISVLRASTEDGVNLLAQAAHAAFNVGIDEPRVAQLNQGPIVELVKVLMPLIDSDAAAIAQLLDLNDADRMDMMRCISYSFITQEEMTTSLAAEALIDFLSALVEKAQVDKVVNFLKAQSFSANTLGHYIALGQGDVIRLKFIMLLQKLIDANKIDDLLEMLSLQNTFREDPDNEAFNFYADTIGQLLIRHSSDKPEVLQAYLELLKKLIRLKPLETLNLFKIQREPSGTSLLSLLFETSSNPGIQESIFSCLDLLLAQIDAYSEQVVDIVSVISLESVLATVDSGNLELFIKYVELMKALVQKAHGKHIARYINNYCISMEGHSGEERIINEATRITQTKILELYALLVEKGELDLVISILESAKRRGVSFGEAFPEFLKLLKSFAIKARVDALISLLEPYLNKADKLDKLLAQLEVLNLDHKAYILFCVLVQKETTLYKVFHQERGPSLSPLVAMFKAILGEAQAEHLLGLMSTKPALVNSVTQADFTLSEGLPAAGFGSAESRPILRLSARLNQSTSFDVEEEEASSASRPRP